MKIIYVVIWGRSPVHTELLVLKMCILHFYCLMELSVLNSQFKFNSKEIIFIIIIIKIKYLSKEKNQTF